eukprot:3397963-Rhodomonas_salina.4
MQWRRLRVFAEDALIQVSLPPRQPSSRPSTLLPTLNPHLQTLIRVDMQHQCVGIEDQRELALRPVLPAPQVPIQPIFTGVRVSVLGLKGSGFRVVVGVSSGSGSGSRVE